MHDVSTHLAGIVTALRGAELRVAAARARLFAVREASVVAYLVGKGIAANRLVGVGYGQERPIDTNRTPDGRARNRRVEFHIVE